MAGGGTLGVERSKRGKASKRKKKKRVGFHLDMTPLVDITFLLLTFFMFTTTMAQPQIMEMSQPPEGNVDVDVIDRQLLTLRLRDDGILFWNIGNDQPEIVALKDLRKLAIRENIDPEVKNKMITLLKVSNDVQYQTVIRILDELNLAETDIIAEVSKDKDDSGNPVKRERKFTMAPLEQEDIELISEEGGEAVK